MHIAAADSLTDDEHLMTNMRTFSKLTLAASLTVVVTALFTGCCGDNGKIKPTKNVILMIPDGTSSTMLPVVRWYKEFKNPQMGAARLATDPYLCGYVRRLAPTLRLPLRLPR